MKTKIKFFVYIFSASLFISLCLSAGYGHAADYQGVTLKFSASHTCTHTPLDSIRIENLTQEGDMMLYYPDTVGVFLYTSVDDLRPLPDRMKLFQNYPNPFTEQTQVEVFLPEGDRLTLSVYDLAGQQVAEYDGYLDPGHHRFTFHAGHSQGYLLLASGQNHASRQVMLQVGGASPSGPSISYDGFSPDRQGVMEAPDLQPGKASTGMVFNLGDELRYTGYVTDSAGNVDYLAKTDTPEADTGYVFEIDNELPAMPAGLSGKERVQGDSSGVRFEVEPVHGVSYVWSVPESWEIDSGQGSSEVIVSTGNASGQVRVYAENACGISPEASMDVEVFFTIHVSADPPEGGTVSPTYAEVEAGDTITITAIPNDEWFFSMWNGNNDWDQKSLTITLNESKDVVAHFSKINVQTHRIDLSDLASVTSDQIKWLESAFHSTIYYRFEGEEYMLTTGGVNWEAEDHQAATLLLKRIDGTWSLIQDYSELEITSEFRNSEFFPNGKGLIGCDHGAEPSETDWPYGHIFYGEFKTDGIKWTKVSDVKSFYHGCAVGDITNNGLYDVLGANLGGHREDSHTDPHVYYQTENGFEFQPNILPDHVASGFFTQIGNLYGDERNEIVRWGFIGEPDGPYLNVEVLTQDDNNEYYLLERFVDDRYGDPKKNPIAVDSAENRHRENTPGNWISDFNNNGLNDIAAENDVFDLNVLFNNGDGSFTREFVTTKESELQEWGGARFMGFELIDLTNNFLPDIITRAFYHYPDEAGYVDLAENVWINLGGKFKRMSELYEGYHIRLNDHTPFVHLNDGCEDQFGFLRGFVSNEGKFGWYGFLQTRSHCHANYDPKALYLIEITTRIDASYID